MPSFGTRGGLMPGHKATPAQSATHEAAKKRGATSATKQKGTSLPVSPLMATQPAEILALQRKYGNQTVQRMLAQRAPTGVIQRLQDKNGKEITKKMVEEASLSELKEWAALERGWEDFEIFELIDARLTELTSPAKETPTAPEVTTPPVTAPRSEPIVSPPVVKSPSEVFAESVKGHPAKAALLTLYDANPELAAAVRDGYDKDSNPRLSEALLTRLASAKLLWINWEKYRESVGGQNGMIYRFWLSKSGGTAVGEWHVHWESGKKAGSPGWKLGKYGEKLGGDDPTVMKGLIGDSRWGVVKGDAGARVQV